MAWWNAKIKGNRVPPSGMLGKIHSAATKAVLSKKIIAMYENNPERLALCGKARRGKAPWNKGLTSTTDPRVAINACNTRAAILEEGLGFAKGPHNPNWKGKAIKASYLAGRKPVNAYSVVLLGVRYKSTWEAKFAAWLRNYGFAFEYEPKAFHCVDGSYIPDFYIPKFHLWVEIKGRIYSSLSGEKARWDVFWRRYLQRTRETFVVLDRYSLTKLGVL